MLVKIFILFLLNIYCPYSYGEKCNNDDNHTDQVISIPYMNNDTYYTTYKLNSGVKTKVIFTNRYPGINNRSEIKITLDSRYINNLKFNEFDLCIYSGLSDNSSSVTYSNNSHNCSSLVDCHKKIKIFKNIINSNNSLVLISRHDIIIKIWIYPVPLSYYDPSIIPISILIFISLSIIIVLFILVIKKYCKRTKYQDLDQAYECTICCI